MFAIITKLGEMTVFKQATLISLMLLLLILAGCDEEDPTPASGDQSDEPASADEISSTGDPDSIGPDYATQDEGIFISEILPGVPGNNN